MKQTQLRRSFSLAPLAAPFALAGALAACGPTPPPATPPAPAPKVLPSPTDAPAAATREQPPPPLASRPSPFPAVSKKTLPNGVRLSVVEVRELPIVELRVVVHAGSGFGPPGVSEITAAMLKEGGTRAHTASELVKRIETLGSSLRVDVGEDATELALGVVRSQLDEGMDILGEVVKTPRFDSAELTRLKAKMTDEAEDNARSNGSWSATRALFHALFPAGSPYANFGVVPAEIAKVDATAIRDFHKRLYVPSNVELIVVGDVDTEGATKAVLRGFGNWKVPAASESAKLEFPPPTPPDATRVIVTNRPKSVQSDIIVTELLPERHAPDWPASRAALQVFGGGGTGRLFRDVREKRSLAYRADARYLELARGQQPLFAYAGTQAPKTAEAVQGVMDNLAGMRTSPPTDDEVATARRFLSDIFAVRMETIGAIADMVGQLRELDLPDDYWDTYRSALRALTTGDVVAKAESIFTTDHALILVSGDADVVAEPLTRFGEVTVVDPEHDFRTIRTLPKSALSGVDRAAPRADSPSGASPSKPSTTSAPK